MAYRKGNHLLRAWRYPGKNADIKIAQQMIITEKQQATQISTAKQAQYAQSTLIGIMIHYLANLNYLLLIATPLSQIDGVILSYV
ncbi:MAG: hypothetical protein K2G20_03455 [Lachnospiraceae bacterium]|nr:hypothetical protein [Lachnospiraceae bacterium]